MRVLAAGRSAKVVLHARHSVIYLAVDRGTSASGKPGEADVAPLRSEAAGQQRSPTAAVRRLGPGPTRRAECRRRSPSSYLGGHRSARPPTDAPRNRSRRRGRPSKALQWTGILASPSRRWPT